jgi:hypothetical protein
MLLLSLTHTHARARARTHTERKLSVVSLRSLPHATVALARVFRGAGEPRSEERARCPKFPIQLNFREGYPRSYSPSRSCFNAATPPFHPFSTLRPSLRTLPPCIIGVTLPTSFKTPASTTGHCRNEIVVTSRNRLPP